MAGDRRSQADGVSSDLGCQPGASLLLSRLTWLPYPPLPPSWRLPCQLVTLVIPQGLQVCKRGAFLSKTDREDVLSQGRYVP